jgi:hypothetical protein
MKKPLPVPPLYVLRTWNGITHHSVEWDLKPRTLTEENRGKAVIEEIRISEALMGPTAIARRRLLALEVGRKANV